MNLSNLSKTGAARFRSAASLLACLLGTAALAGSGCTTSGGAMVSVKPEFVEPAGKTPVREFTPAESPAAARDDAPAARLLEANVAASSAESSVTPVAASSAAESLTPQVAALAPDVAAIEADWGIRILSLRLTAAGFMLDFRYRVIDPAKALPLFDRATEPRLIDQASGRFVLVPRTAKIGPLRNSDEPIANTNFFILFDNPRRFIQRGSKVTVVVGDFKVENLTVE